ncbi:hypothetical protein BV22DRAFT_1125225 [Leucogyrophana mollusca]|uniref:Uncharacterized protein n=1 Tax=Leucogyrophana mollusca TaxID=85980 RepID=A0ACB8BVT2_9AGAM|nr:hypothetical protein BV22DRAFT_1125225 [Leucogyrophana mollusca]
MSDLSNWTQSRLSAVYEAPDDDTLQKAFDAAFSSKCEVFVSQEPAAESLETLRDQLSNRRSATIGSKVSWENAPTVKADELSTGPADVTGSFVVTRSLKFRIRAAPVQRLTHVTFEAKVDQGDAGTADIDNSRHIVSFRYTSEDSTPPIHFNTPHAAGAEVAKE